MNLRLLFEIKKFKNDAVFFTDRGKVLDFEKAINNLPKNSKIIIREYDLDKKNREIFAKKIADLAQAKGIKILVGKDFELAKKINADGIHFSDKDRLPLQFFKKKSFKKNFIFSLSCHGEKSFLRFQKIKPNIIFLSPIFSSTSHLKASNLGLINLAKIIVKNKKHNYPATAIFALGGINLRNIKSLIKLDISGFGAIDLFTKKI
jgi:thiamine monophosphate synthase